MFLNYLIIGLYTTTVIILTIYFICGFLQGISTLKTFKTTCRKQEQTDLSHELPSVTVQLPIYNEFYVVEQLLEQISKLQYPRHQLEIQVLDDSTDETSEIIARKVIELKAQGLQIEHIQRNSRIDFKAGNLQNGMKFAKGEFIAIFDADCLPEPDFLLATIPHFRKDETLGGIQTCLHPLNYNDSWISRLQTFEHAIHFHLEQPYRLLHSSFLPCSGTGSVWRTSAIEDVGGWQGDTLAEDLDISIRIYLNNWKAMYLEYVALPYQIASNINSYKTQRYRWVKGTAEVLRKHFCRIYNSQISVNKKIELFSLVLECGIYILILLNGFASLLLYLVKQSLNNTYFGFIYVLYATCLAVNFLQYYTVINNKKIYVNSDRIMPTLYHLIIYTLEAWITIGLAWQNTIAITQGLIGIKTSFVRTPKFNHSNFNTERSLQEKQYLNYQINWLVVGEGMIGLLFAFVTFLDIYNLSSLWLIHIICSLVFIRIFYCSVKDGILQNSV